MIETFLVWLLGPSLAVGASIIFGIVSLSSFLGAAISIVFYCDNKRWPWEKS